VNDRATERSGPSREQRALAVIRIALGVMFIWVFFENLGKGLYSPAGYKGLIEYYLKNGHSPGAWKAIMSMAAANARFAAPLQAMTELGFGVLLVTGTATRLVAAAAGGFLFTLWLSELGTAWVWELGIPVIVAFCVAAGRAGRGWGLDAAIVRRKPDWILG
jgi:uncharacterized membrane protein YphA (DoxX/SURF4 family)